MAKQPFVIVSQSFKGKRDKFGRPIVRVDRKTWACGGDLGESALLNDDGNMCCLGFASDQLEGGLPSDILLGLQMPNELGSPVAEGWREKHGSVQKLLNQAAQINDRDVSSSFTHRNRERLLKSQALKLGFVFLFHGRRPPLGDD